MNYERSIKDTFIEYSKSFKSVLLTGPRQVGKTTLLLDIKEEDRKYVTLDDLEIRRLAKENPKKFIETYSPPVIIDEIQYAPDLMSYIKIICDNTTKKGLFWLTGSQKIQVMKNVSETLAGRMGVLEMNSFSYKEITKIKYLPHDLNDLTLKEELTKDQVLKNILRGGMPGYIFDNIKKELYFKSYIDLYLERDIRELKQIEDLNAFYTFLVSIASRASQLLNYASIAKDCGKDEKTIKSWISILEATDIIKLVYPIRKEELKRITSAPKIIFMDSGLCTYLCHLNTIKSLEEYTNLGFLFENYCISELIKLNSNYNLGEEFYFYRDKDGSEIDLIIKDYEGIHHPYEIKLKKRVDISMISSFKKIDNLSNVGKGGIICLNTSLKELTPKNQIIPLSSLIL